MYAISSEQIIGSYAVKYSTLIPLINLHYSGSHATVINIYIDLASMFKTIAHQPVTTNSFSLAASIINLCAHYRNFFKEYYKTDTNFFLIFSDVDNDFINKKFIPSYKRNIFGNNPSTNDSIIECMNLLDLLVPYINDIGFYKTNYEFGVKVLDIITHYNNPNLLITKDPYNLQLVSEETGFVNILRCVKNKDGDLSYIVSRDQAILEMCLVRKCDPPKSYINSSLISLIYALSRVPERGLQSVFQLPKVLKAISNALDRGIILNEHTIDIEYICKIFSEHKLLDIKDPNYIDMRFKAIDIESQYFAYCHDPKEEKFNGMKNLYDPTAVKEISMKYFKNYPLDLNVL